MTAPFRDVRDVPAVRASAAMLACLAVLTVVTPGCQDRAKQSAGFAAQDVATVADLIERDVAEIERGMPQGATQLVPLVANGADPRKDIAAVRRALLRVRRDVVDLDVAKSTFFALADPTGIAIRNDLEEDVMAGQNLFTIFPALTKAGSAFVTTTGAFPNAPAANGPDEDWIAGVPVKRADGSTGAVFVTGWSYRYFARHLQEAIKSHLADQAKASGNEGKLPVYYVFVFDKSGVYPAPLTPLVDVKALEERNLVALTAGGPAQGTLTITDRAFGFAALRTPKLAPDTGAVVLRSEL